MNKIFFWIFLFIFSSPIDASKKQKDWFFYKTSVADINNKSDAEVIDAISIKYSTINIFFDGERLYLKDSYSASSDICNYAYISKKQTLLSYYWSQKSVDIYHDLFVRSDIPFLQSINVLLANNPDYKCPYPYDELVEVGDFITLVDQDYIVFFKHKNEDQKKGIILLNYCHEVRLSEEFDGRSRMVCNFGELNLKEAYKKLISDAKFYREFLRPVLPLKDIKYEREGRNISYQWTGTRELKIIVEADSESEIYNFQQNASGTELVNDIETQY